ncbi:hypothetical protein PoB_001823900 [Plakobranchus ocellatus]|uniref:Uncharacterized protein n=1 Tax=Plakobranchus ocellatus TaxID=259542 RepID=A0AAV3ZCX1_9GAST|nr:hypothetical protein PoB_001823900 [Plakobranchus ocellatus]
MTGPASASCEARKAPNTFNHSRFLLQKQILRHIEKGDSFRMIPPTVGHGVDFGGDSAEKHEQCSSWREALLSFAENTTLHGLRFVFLDTSHILRR